MSTATGEYYRACCLVQRVYAKEVAPYMKLEVIGVLVALESVEQIFLGHRFIFDNQKNGGFESLHVVPS